MLKSRRFLGYGFVCIVFFASLSVGMGAWYGIWRRDWSVRFDERHHDFGRVATGASLAHDFTFVNTGRLPIDVDRAITSCGCLVDRVDFKTVQPGQTGVVRLELRTKGIVAPYQMQRTAIVKFKQGDLDAIPLTVEADIRPDLVVNPSHFDVAARGSASVAMQELSIKRDSLSAAAFLGVRVIAPRSYCTVEEMERSGEVIRLKVHILPSMVTRAATPIKVVYETDHKTHHVLVPVERRRVDDVGLSPDICVVTVDSSAAIEQLRSTSKRCCRIVSPRHADVAVTGVWAPQSDEQVLEWCIGEGENRDTFTVWMRKWPEDSILVYSAVLAVSFRGCDPNVEGELPFEFRAIRVVPRASRTASGGA